MADPQISLDTTPQPTQINIDAGPGSVVLDSDTAANKAFKASFGLPKFNYSYDDLYKGMMNGEEDQLREAAAAHADFLKESYKQEAISKIASKLNRPMTNLEIGTLHSLLSQKPKTDPQSVFEEYYSLEYLDKVKQTGLVDPESPWSSVNPDYMDHSFFVGKDYKSRQEMLKTGLERAEAAAQAQGWTGSLIDRAKSFFPGYTNVKERGRIGTGFFAGGLLGENINEQAKNYFAMPSSEAKEKFLADSKKFTEDNPGLSLAWHNALLHQSYSDKLMDDTFSLFDVPYSGTLAKGAVNLARSSVRTGIKSALKAGSREPVSHGAIEEASGNLKEAAVKDLTENIIKTAQGKQNPIYDSLKGLQDIFTGHISEIDQSMATGKLSLELGNRMKEQFTAFQAQFFDALANNLKVKRVPVIDAAQASLRDLADQVAYPGLENRIMNAKFRYDPAINGHWVDFYMGDKGPLMFPNKKTAEAWVKSVGFKEYEISGETQKGSGYAVRISRPLPETIDGVRDLLVTIPDAVTPHSWLNALIGRARTPNETLSDLNVMARLAATYGMGPYFKISAQNFKDVQKLRNWALPLTNKRQKWKDWRDAVWATKGLRDKRTGELHPLLDTDEWNNHFQNRVGRLPDEQEIAAYYGYKRDELMFRALDMHQQYKDMHRVGAQEHTIRVFQKGGGELFGKGKSEEMREANVIGTRMNEFPKGDDPLLIVGRRDGDEKLITPSRFSGKIADQYRKDVKEGKRIAIRVYNPYANEVKNFLSKQIDSPVKWIVVDSAETKNINWSRLQRARMPDYEFEHYAAQPMMKHDTVSKKSIYLDDRNVAGFMIRNEGTAFVEKLNKIREFLKNKDEAGAIAYHQQVGMSIPFKTINGWFKSRYLSVDDAIHLVSRDKKTIDLEKNAAHPEIQYANGLKGKTTSFKDSTMEGYGRTLPGQTSYRDLYTDVGTRANPLYNSATSANHLDPIQSLNRAMNKVINSTFMNDYKIFSIEHWLQEARDLLDFDQAAMRRSPFYYFFQKPTWKAGGGPQTSERIANLETARLQIQQFMGMQSRTATALHGISQTLVDSIYNTGVNKKWAMTPAWLLPKLRDPFSYIRSVTMDMKMGLFSPAQLWVQSQTFVNIWGIAGARFAAPGTKAALLHQYSRFNDSPEIINYLDKLASKKIIPGTRPFLPGEWKEARDWLARTGFEHVGGEYVKVDSPWIDLVKNERQQFLDWGRIPFREGERNVRIGAWYTAFREFRHANPAGKITEDTVLKIFKRADDLYGNMSRASASQMQNGLMSIPTQFLSYQMRVAELFMGKRLTQSERRSLMATYAVVYGIPGAFGLSGLPIGDYIRKWALEDGYNVGDNFINSAVTEGIPAAMLALATGNWYDINERYGVQGFEPLREALRSDQTFLKIIGGAAFSTMYNTWYNKDGFINAVMSMVRQDGKFALKIDDFVDPFLEISSVNTAKRFVAALNTAKWISRKEGYLDDTSMSNAIFMTLSGLQSQKVTDMNFKSWIMNTEKGEMKEALGKFIREWHRAIQDQSNNDPEQANSRMKRAMVYLEQAGYPIEKIPEAIAIAARGWEKAIDSSNWDFYMKPGNVPEYRKPQAGQTYFNTLKGQ